MRLIKIKEKSRIKKNVILSSVLFLAAMLTLSGTAFAENSGQTVKQTPLEKESHISAGVGLGIPYGVLGVNVEFSPLLPGMAESAIHDYFSLSAGVGYSPAGLAYAFGCRIYPMGKEDRIRPRISGYYGVVAMIEYYYDDYDRLEGFAFGGGALYKINRKFSADLEVLYILPNHYSDYLEGGRFKLSFGGRWHL
jgi:hypothetical protein